MQLFCADFFCENLLHKLQAAGVSKTNTGTAADSQACAAQCREFRHQFFMQSQQLGRYLAIVSLIFMEEQRSGIVHNSNFYSCTSDIKSYLHCYLRA